jgi:hypothetical protein
MSSRKTLTNCGLLEVRESPIEGFGVFAKGDIKAGTILEECPIILFPRYVTLAKNIFETLRNNGWVSQKELFMENIRENFRFKSPESYYFKWHPPVQLDPDSMFTVLPLGYGPIYNTSNTSNNADWKMQRDTFIFRAEKDIKKDEEIVTFYGYFLGEDGSSYNCENVFHLGIDMFPSANGQSHKVKLLRFGSTESLNVQRANPAAHRFHHLIQSSTHGLSIRKLTLQHADGTVVASFDIPEEAPVSMIYRRLAELRQHPAPLVKFQVEYLPKGTIPTVTEEILWKK